MQFIRRLVSEVHRRSLWQVLAIFVATSWGVLQAIDVLINRGMVPDWVFGAGVVLLLLGLPVVLATAFVQERDGRADAGGADAGAAAAGRAGAGGDPEPAAAAGAPPFPRSASASPGASSSPHGPASPRAAAAAPAHHRLLTWRNAVLGGVCAFALLGFASAGYMGMRTFGIGAPGTLQAQGVFGDRERVVLAEFSTTLADSAVGRLVTEALRVDLVESPAVSVLPATYVTGALRRIGRPAGTPLTPELAREIAVRDGVKAVIQGDIGAAGSGYVLTATIVEASTGTPLAAFREAAAAESDLLKAVDRLSGRIRGKAGESLRSVKASEPLSAVTTTSLDALRAYTSSLQLAWAGDREAGIRMLRSAIELDPEFAMAHRRLAVELWNLRLDPVTVQKSATRAWELRDRLSRLERLYAEGTYHMMVSGDWTRANDTWRQLLRDYPEEVAAAGNMVSTRRTRAEAEEGVELLIRAIDSPARVPSLYLHLVHLLWELRRDDEIDAWIDEARELYPDVHYIGELRPLIAMGRRDFEAAHAGIDSLRRHHAASPGILLVTSEKLFSTDAGRGHLQELRTHVAEHRRLAVEQQSPSWNVAGADFLAWVELFAARSPENARASLRHAEQLLDDADVDAEALLSVATSAALAGDADLSSRLEAAYERLRPGGDPTPQEQRSLLYLEWARAMARDDGAAALDAIDRFQRLLVGDCAGRRCFGEFQRGMALDLLGRTSDAIAAFESHLSGSPLLNTFNEGVLTPVALERLAELHEQRGDRARAADYYARFAAMWKDADAELQPRVRRAQQRALELQGRG